MRAGRRDRRDLVSVANDADPASVQRKSRTRREIFGLADREAVWLAIRGTRFNKDKVRKCRFENAVMISDPNNPNPLNHDKTLRRVIPSLVPSMAALTGVFILVL